MADTIRWSDLGSPTASGDISVPGLGIVGVTDIAIARAAECDSGNPLFELIPAGAAKDPTQSYKLGKIISE